MGVGNVKLVYARWYHLPDLPFRVLVYMALRSMDNGQPPVYYAGWEELALAAGRQVPDENDGDKEVTKTRRAALKAVASVIATLTARGAIRVSKAAAPRRNTTYELTIVNGAVHAQREPSPGIDSTNGSRSADTTVHGEPTNGSRSAGQTVHAQRAPEEYEEEVRTDERTESVDLRAPLTLRAHEAETDPIPVFPLSQTTPADRRPLRGASQPASKLCRHGNYAAACRPCRQEPQPPEGVT